MPDVSALLKRLFPQPGSSGVWKGYLDPQAILDLAEAGAEPERSQVLRGARLDLEAGRHQSIWVYWRLPETLRMLRESHSASASSEEAPSGGVLDRSRYPSVHRGG